MLRKVISIVISMALILPMVGCTRKAEDERVEMLLGDHPAFDFGELAAFDSNGDGSEDLFVYTFEKEELDDDLFLQRTVEYRDTEAGYMGELILEFENEGQKTKTYSHIEIIPKSFAETFDDLEFSIPPDEVINPDPQLRWDVEVVKGTIEKLLIKAKKTAEETGRKTGMEAAQPSMTEAKESAEEFKEALEGDLSNIDWEKAFVSGISATGSGLEAMEKGQEAGMQAGVEAAIGVILENLDDFAFIHAVEKCARLKSGTEEKDACILELVARFPERLSKYSSSVCDEIYANAHYGVMCKAILEGNVSHCETIKDDFDKDLCKAVAIESLCDMFEDVKERESCITTNAICQKCILSCYSFEDDDKRNECLAMVTQDKKYCEKIEDEELRAKCLETIAAEVERQRAEGTLYDIEKWFPNELESNIDYSNRFQVILPDAFQEASGQGGCSAVESMGSLDCEFRCTPNSYVWGINLVIHPHPTDVDAREEWLKDLELHWSPEQIEYLEADHPDSRTTVSEDEVVFAWEENDGIKTLFTTMKEIRYKNCRIYITETNAHTKSDVLLNDVETWAKQLIDEKRQTK